jgi:hypothetical protein
MLAVDVWFHRTGDNDTLRRLGGDVMKHPWTAVASVIMALILSDSAPGLGTRLARCRNYVFAPNQLAGRAVERDDEVTNSVVTTSRPEHDLILDREWRSSEL